MRTFEFLLLAALALRFLAPSVFARRSWVVPAYLALLASLVASHLLLEGARWNLLLVYLFAFGTTIDLARRAFAQVDGRPTTRLLATGAAAVTLSLAALPAWLLPVPHLPAPTGPYPVGTDTLEYALPEDVPRAIDGVDRVRARIWYPADAAATAGAACGDTWLEHEASMLPGLARRAGLPGFALGHLAHVATHACWRVDAVPLGTLPIVTLDHGRGGFAAQSSYLAEELASHGYVVVAPDHPGGAVLSIFRDGTRVPFDDASFGGGLEGDAYDAAIRALGERWIGETLAAIDALEGGQGPETLRGRVTREGWIAMGHSTGGGAAFGACARDRACAGVVGLDPWMLPTPPDLLEAGLDVPVAALFSDPALEFFEPVNRVGYDLLAAATERNDSPTFAVTYAGVGHMDFADVALLSPIADQLGLYVGPLGGEAVVATVRSDVVSLVERMTFDGR